MKDVNLIDIEASGLGIDSYPVEIAILVDNRLFSWLIVPEESWQYWDKTAESMHGISREILISQGKVARFVADAINDAMTNSNGLLYSDAAEWDADWLKTLFDAVGAVADFHILPVGDLLAGAAFRQFQQKREEIANSGKYRPHRAEQDIRIIHAALIAVCQAAKQE